MVCRLEMGRGAPGTNIKSNEFKKTRGFSHNSSARITKNRKKNRKKKKKKT